jgi:protein PET100
MGGLRLEAFKFGLYLTVPIFALLHFGDPEWYRKNVVPVSSVMGQPRRISITTPVSG